MRKAKAAFGHNAAMGYEFRAYIVEKERPKYFLFGPKVTKYHYVIEKYFCNAWDKYDTSWDFDTREEAEAAANGWLDDIETEPEKDFV